MADFLMRQFQVKDVSLTEEIVGNIVRAALVLCVLWYATLVILRPSPPILKQSPDADWVVVEGRAEHVAA